MSAPLEKLLRDARIDLVLARIEKDESLLNEVIAHLDSDIRSVKFNSILVLGEVGERAAEAVSKITSCLEDEDWSICREAARSLGKIGNLARDAVPILSTLLKDKEESIRKEAATALGKIKNPTIESITSLINTLDDESELVRTEAAISLGEIGSDAFEAIPKLMESLKDVSWVVRTASAQSISQIGKNSTKAIPALISALEDSDWRVRYRVVNTLTEIGEAVVPNVLEVLTHKNKLVRKEAIEVLGELKIADSKIIDKISELLTDKAEIVRGKAADALRSIGKAAVPALVNNIESASKKMKLVIISALGGIGPDAIEALPNLIELLDIGAEDIDKRKERIYLKPLKLEEVNPSKREKILYFFQKNLKKFKLSIQESIGIFSAAIKTEAVRAIGKIAIDSEEATNALEFSLTEPILVVRRESALSLGNLGSLAIRAVPSLIEALYDLHRDVRWRASEALGKIGVDTEEVVYSLNELIHDKCDYVCESAINAIDSLTEE